MNVYPALTDGRNYIKGSPETLRKNNPLKDETSSLVRNVSEHIPKQQIKGPFYLSDTEFGYQSVDLTGR
jgi:hypothetical protein